MTRFPATISMLWVIVMIAASSQPCFSGTPGLRSNALLDRKSNTARLLYPIADTNSKQSAVSYIQEGDLLKAVYPNGETAWTNRIAGTGLFGGFDFDQDGWPDLGFVLRKPTGRIENKHPIHTTQLFLIHGKTGEALEATEPLEDKWWPAFGYPTEQWNQSGLLFGAHIPVVSLAPFYATQGFFCRYAGGQFQKDRYEYPSTPAYDKAYRNAKTNAYETAYRNAKTNAYSQPWCYVENSHVNNGLFVRVNGQDRLLFFTSARVVQYAVTAFGPEQLVCDHPFLNGNREALAGRQYGLVSVDPAAGQVVTIMAGTHAFSVYSDLKAGKLAYDAWGAIERHVTRYDAATDTLDHRFYSYAHDNKDGDKYRNRVVYPNTVYIPGKSGQASRLAYNVYQDGQWQLHISKPGSTADEIVRPGVFLWDIVSRDGQPHLVASPTRPPDADNGYFPRWQTDLYIWDDTRRNLTPLDSMENVIPHLLPAFREGGKSTTYGSLFPVLRVEEDGEERLLLEQQDGQLVLEGE
ncbi:MAG: hypothetical protein HY343_05635 [Lentisphaerae bacterium]|nr:hypothetical protein [Lentisphaerota bacterium]